MTLTERSSASGNADPVTDRRGALDRGLDILEYLSEAREASTASIAGHVRLTRSTAYRLLDRLQQRGFVDQRCPGIWVPGAASARLAMAAVHSADVVQVAPEFLRILVQQARETVGLAVPYGDEMVFVYGERGPHFVSVNSELGGRRPLHCTSVGKAYLTALPLSERAPLIRRLTLRKFTAHTIVSPDDLEVEVLRTRERGWSEDRAEFDEDSTCCGAAIYNHAGYPIAAISVAGPTARTTSLLGRLGGLVASTAEAISRRLGYNLEQ